MKNRKSQIANRKCRRGLSLIEVLISLAITAMLLAATMVAIDASFKSYASAAEQASSQAGLRMVSYRLLQLIRTSTAQGPLVPAGGPPTVTLSGDTIISPYIEVLDAHNNIVRVEYKADVQQLWMSTTPAAGGATITQPLMDGVTSATFYCLRRTNSQNLLVLERGTMDITVQPGADATLAIESGTSAKLRLIASTMPRKMVK